MDTIVGSFGIGLIPTGTADPFGLRRQALGIIRIILEKQYVLSLVELIEESGKLLKEKLGRSFAEVRAEVLDFFRTRYQYLLLEKGVPFDVVDSVISISFDDLLDVQHRIDALRVAREWEDFGSIVIGFKRAMNILKGTSSKEEVRPSLFNAPEEQRLYQSLLEAKERMGLHLKQRAYEGALLEMTKMKQPIDGFFDKVMVMVEDEPLRNNRLALLDGIGQLFLRIADFSKLT
jgi:glycyl-tRNA synthetase beta chain